MRSKLSVVGHELKNEFSRLCHTSASSCPFGPGQTSFFHSFNVSQAYQGVPFNVRFVIINAVDGYNLVGCVEAQVTPIIANYAWYVIVFCIVGIAVLIAFSFFITAYLNPWTGTTNVYSWASVLYREVNVVRLLTPGLFDFLHYFQYAFFLSCLSLDYPPFLQPITKTYSWVVLMFKHSFTSSSSTFPGGKLQDGIYSSNGLYGMDRMRQILQLNHPIDVWPSFMIWLLTATGAFLLLGEVSSLGTWIWRKYKSDNYDMRSRNLSFAIGIVIRMFFRVFHLPLLTFSFFQCAITHLKDTDDAAPVPVYLPVLAALVLVAWVALAVFISYYLWRRAPHPTIFDNVSTLLKFGTLYNTYSERAAMFFVVEFVTTFFRALAIGAIQISGLAQITLLAVIELAYFFAVIIVKPFDHETGMNLITSIFTGVRFVLIMLSLPFISSASVPAEARQLLGYIILLFHGFALLLFLMRAIQVIIEVISRYTGAGADSKRTGAIYSLKQLSRRRRPRVDSFPSTRDVKSVNNPNDAVPADSDINGDRISAQDDEEEEDGLHAPNKLRYSITNPNTVYDQREYSAIFPAPPIIPATKDGSFDDGYLPSPNSEGSVFPHSPDTLGFGAATGHNIRNSIGTISTSNTSNNNSIHRSLMGFSDTRSLKSAHNKHKGVKITRSHTDYYRKPRSKNLDNSRNRMTIDFDSNGAITGEGDYNDKDGNESETPESGPTLDQIRMGIVSPPPQGVDYAVREADIYYRQRAMHHGHKHKKRHSNYTSSTSTADYTPGGSEDFSRSLLRHPYIDYEPYQGAASLLDDNNDESNNGRIGHLKIPSEYADEYYSRESTPGQESGDELNSHAKNNAIGASGVLQRKSRRSRNLNSLVGLLEMDEMNSNGALANYSGGNTKPKGLNATKANSSSKGLKAAEEHAFNAVSTVSGWLSKVKQNIGNLRHSQPEIDPLEPRGFEVIRRGPIRPYVSSSSSSSSSSRNSSSADLTNYQHLSSDQTETITSPAKAKENFEFAQQLEDNFNNDTTTTIRASNDNNTEDTNNNPVASPSSSSSIPDTPAIDSIVSPLMTPSLSQQSPTPPLPPNDSTISITPLIPAKSTLRIVTTSDNEDDNIPLNDNNNNEKNKKKALKIDTSITNTNQQSNDENSKELKPKLMKKLKSKESFHFE